MDSRTPGDGGLSLRIWDAGGRHCQGLGRCSGSSLGVGGAAHSGERCQGGPGWGPHRLHPILRLLLSGRDCSGGDHDWFYTPPPPGAGERQKERERQSGGASVGDKKGGSGLFIPSIEVRPADCHP